MSPPRLPRVTEIYQPASDGASPERYAEHALSRVRAAELARAWQAADLVTHLRAVDEPPEARLVAAVLLAERSLADSRRSSAAIEAMTPLVPSTLRVPFPDGEAGRLAWTGVALDLGREIRALVERLATGVVLERAAWRALVQAWLAAGEIPAVLARAFHEQEPDLAYATLSARAFAGWSLEPERRTWALRALLARGPGSSAGPADRATSRHLLHGWPLLWARSRLLETIQDPSSPASLRFDWAIEWKSHDHARFRYFRDEVERGSIDRASRYLVPYLGVEYESRGPFSTGSLEASAPARWLVEGLAIAESGDRVREVLLAVNTLLGGFHGLKEARDREGAAPIHAALLERPDAWVRLMAEARRPHLPSLGLATIAVALRSPELTRTLEETCRLRRAESPSPDEPLEPADFEDLDYALRWIRQGSAPPL